MIPAEWRVKHEYPHLGELSAWAIGARYPSDIEDPDAEEAGDAVRLAAQVLMAVERDLKEHDLRLE